MTVKETRNISDLFLWKDNPRGIKVDAYDRLKERIKRWGQFKPLIITPEGEVLGGNMRLRAYTELGIKDIWVSIVDPKTEAEKIEIALADNEELGYYEDQRLAELVSKYKTEINLKDYQIHLERSRSLEDILNEFQPEVIEDEVPDITDKAISKLGEVYQLGRHRLMCGDSTKIEDVEKLMNGQKADMVFTDPPYGMDLDTDFSKMPRGVNKYNSVIGDNKDFDAGIIFATAKADKYYIWGADWFYTTMPKGFSPIVWDKQPQEGEAGPQNHFELCWAFPKEKRRIIRKLWTGYTATEKNEKRTHPTQKPIEVCMQIMGKGEGSVLDLFGGSGSTLIACEQLNRTCYMMEIDPKYVDVIRKRYAKFIGKEDQWEEVSPKI